MRTFGGAKKIKLVDVTGPVGHRAACVVKGCLGYCDSSTHATIYSRNMGNTPVAQAIYTQGHWILSIGLIYRLILSLIPAQYTRLLVGVLVSTFVISISTC